MTAGPEILIDLDRIRENAKTVAGFCRSRGISVTGVTKVCCGLPPAGRAMLEGGVVSLGESRIENIRRLRAGGINAPMMMLRIPPLSQVEEIVSSADISLNSELPVIRKLSEAALRKGKVHKIILMIDLGDLREGIWPRDLMETTSEVLKLGGVKIVGVGTNLTCFGAILPTRKNMEQLVAYAEEIEGTFGISLDIISGGNSSSLPLILEGGMPPRVNHLRIGEAIMLGRETVNGTLWPGCSGEAFQLSAELIELKWKPSLPIGESGKDAFGGRPVFTDRGEILRGILNVGREDVQTDSLVPRDPGVSILGASSDHLIVDLSGAETKPELGKRVLFNMNYGALLAAMTSGYVSKTLLKIRKKEMDFGQIVMIGNSPLFTNQNLLKHLDQLNLKRTLTTEPVGPEAIEKILRKNNFPFIGGDINKTAVSVKGLASVFEQTGLIILSPRASLLTEKNVEDEEKFLSEILGIIDSESDSSSSVSPENTVIIGLREAETDEVDLIRERGITAYTMEDVDLLGMREIMIEALRKACSGTDGFFARISSDVINADGEGLTFREGHLAMEMIADSGQMRAFDISGTPHRSWIDDRALSAIVESAFGKRILKIRPS